MPQQKENPPTARGQGGGVGEGRAWYERNESRAPIFYDFSS